MLEIAHASWQAGGHAVIEDIHLRITSGELTVLIGPSGSGKTSLLRLAAGLIAPTTGHCSNRFARSTMVFQETRLLSWASALDNVSLVLETRSLGKRQKREKAAQWLSRLGLSAQDFAKRPAQLSGGMRARVAIARAFVGDPDFVMMDEPFAALDLGLRRDLQSLTRNLADETGAAVLFVTHDLPEAVRLADRILVMDGRPGRLTAEVANTPVENLAAIWQGAAQLAGRAEIRPVLDGLVPAN